jgi:hypothetical protein
MKKILDLNSIINLNISGSRCKCFCLGDEYGNRNELLALTGIESHQNACMHKCRSLYLTANSHCKEVEIITKPSTIT